MGKRRNLFIFFNFDPNSKKNGTCRNTQKIPFFLGDPIRIILKPGYFFVFLFMKDKIGTIIPGYHFRAIPFFYDFLPVFTRYHFRGHTWSHLVPREIYNFCSPGPKRDIQFSRCHEGCAIFALLVPREIYNFCSPGFTRYIQFSRPYLVPPGSAL